MKFKIDENLPREFADILCQAGYDAKTVFDEGLQGKTDPVIADVCQNEERIIVTLDRDFSDIRTYPPGEYHGIMVLSVARQDKPLLINVLRRTIPLLNNQSLENSLWIVEESRIRIRCGF